MAERWDNRAFELSAARIEMEGQFCAIQEAPARKQ
jgi:hypothetical protein